MDNSVFRASIHAPYGAPTAPGENIPAWLWRRALYLLNRELPATDIHYHIRDQLTLQTGIRIPDRLMAAIAAQFMTLTRQRREDIEDFDESAMHPGRNRQIQQIPPVRPQPTAARTPAARPLGMSTGELAQGLLGSNRPRPTNYTGIKPLRNTSSPTSFLSTASSPFPNLANRPTRGRQPKPNASIVEEAAERKRRFQEQAAAAQREKDRKAREDEAARLAEELESDDIQDFEAELSEDDAPDYDLEMVQGADGLLNFRIPVAQNSLVTLEVGGTEVDDGADNTLDDPVPTARSRSTSPVQRQPNHTPSQTRSPRAPTPNAAQRPGGQQPHLPNAQERPERPFFDRFGFGSVFRETVSYERTRFAADPDQGGDDNGLGQMRAYDYGPYTTPLPGRDADQRVPHPTQFHTWRERLFERVARDIEEESLNSPMKRTRISLVRTTSMKQKRVICLPSNPIAHLTLLCRGIGQQFRPHPDRIGPETTMTSVAKTPICIIGAVPVASTSTQ